MEAASFWAAAAAAAPLDLPPCRLFEGELRVLDEETPAEAAPLGVAADWIMCSSSSLNQISCKGREQMGGADVRSGAPEVSMCRQASACGVCSLAGGQRHFEATGHKPHPTDGVRR